MFLLVQRLNNSNLIRDRIIENFLTQKAVVEFLEYVQFQTTGVPRGIFLSELLEKAIQEECSHKTQTTTNRIRAIASRYFPHIEISQLEAAINQRILWNITNRHRIPYLDMLARGQKVYDPIPQTVPAQIESDSYREEEEVEFEESSLELHPRCFKSSEWAREN